MASPDDSFYSSMSEVDFYTTQAEVFQALLRSKDDGTSIGIKVSALGPETIITAVEDIIFNDGETIIVLKHYDSSGYILQSYRINLFEITAVCSFASPFTNPYLNSIGKERTWFF